MVSMLYRFRCFLDRQLVCLAHTGTQILSRANSLIEVDQTIDLALVVPNLVDLLLAIAPHDVTHSR